MRANPPIDHSTGLRGRVLTYRPELDGLRALSIFLVISAHLAWHPFRFGSLGVDVFFVLSGYLITQVLLRTTPTRSAFSAFYRRRFARLAPGLLLMVLLVSVLSATGLWSFPLWAPFAAVFYFMNLVGFFVPADEVAEPLNPTWSLASEEQFYLLWPLLMFSVLKRYSRTTLAHLCVATVAVVYVLQFFLSSEVSDSLRFHGPFFRPAGLLMGCAVALYQPVSRRVGLLMFLPLLASLALALRSTNGLFVSAATAALLVILDSGTPLVTPIKKALSIAPLPALGRRSYSLYLYNLPVLMLVNHFLGLSLLSNAVGLTLVLAIASASYRFVELPALRRFSPKQPAQTSTDH